MVLCDGHYCMCTRAVGRDGVAADAKHFGPHHACMCDVRRLLTSRRQQRCQSALTFVDCRAAAFGSRALGG